MAFEPDPIAAIEGWGSAKPMPHPLVLYRSVSVPELIDIWRTGEIRGGGNGFNPADPRPFAFFADGLDERLIRQGEDPHRQAHFASLSHEVSRDCDRIAGRIRAHADLILQEFDRDRIWYDHEDVEWFRKGEGTGRFKRAGRRRDWKKYAPLFRKLGQLKKREWALWEEHGRLVEHLACQVAGRKATLSVTSAVLVTNPIDGGLLYAGWDGGCGLGEREYGFRPGQVRLGDVNQIILIKDGREVGRCTATKLGAFVTTISNHKIMCSGGFPPLYMDGTPPLFLIRGGWATARQQTNPRSVYLASRVENLASCLGETHHADPDQN